MDSQKAFEYYRAKAEAYEQLLREEVANRHGVLVGHAICAISGGLVVGVLWLIAEVWR